MELKIFRCLWGVKQIDEAALAGYKQAGYQGIEYKSRDAIKYDSFGAWCKKYDLDFIAQIHTTGNSVDEHLSSFESLINTALSLQPICINSQSGCDFWTLSEKHRFMEAALKVEEKYGILIAHETHRSRITYTPWDTSALIDSFPDMHTCCDFSHWVNVCERLLFTENVHIEKTVAAAIHLHARVGYEQGPQVPDPRAPEYKTHLEAHEKWWTQLWRKQQENGLRFSSACPEYGPPLYQHTLPNSGEPVSDLQQITDWAMHRLKSRFQSAIIN